MSFLSVETIRRDFPLFMRPEHESLSYLDSAATTQKPESVLQAMQEFYTGYNANAHRGSYAMAEKATAEYENARARIARFIHAEADEQIVFTRNTTEAINFVARGWAEKYLKAGDEIIITELEHHSNLVPWQIVAERTGAILHYVSFDEQGRLDLEQFRNLLNKRTRLLSVGHISNALGTINPIEILIQEAHAVKALVVIDAAQSVPHRHIDVQNLNADFLAFSGHKMLGPLGIGVLYGRRELLLDMDPVLFGGSMIGRVEHFKTTWNDLPWKFEAGTQNIPGALGLAAAIDYLDRIGMEAVAEHDRALTGYALSQLSAIKGLTMYGPLDHHGPAISFNMEGLHPHDVATFLDQQHVAVRSGHHCAQLVMKKLEVAATARASFYLYNDTRDIDRLVEGLLKAKDYFKKWL
jgi:cysteine desulfurase / selenocysteine lyase